MQQLLVLLPAPFGLLYTWIQPLEPTRLALLGWLSMQQRCYTTPLVFAIFHYSRFQDLILKSNHRCYGRIFPQVTSLGTYWDLELEINISYITSVFRQTPPFIIIRGILDDERNGRPHWFACNLVISRIPMRRTRIRRSWSSLLNGKEVTKYSKKKRALGLGNLSHRCRKVP